MEKFAQMQLLQLLILKMLIFNETTANQLKDIYSVDGKASIWGDVIETK